MCLNKEFLRTGLTPAYVFRGAFERAKVEKELDAARASLVRERRKREQLEESLRRLNARSGRSASASSEPGCIADTISPVDLLYGERHTLLVCRYPVNYRI